MIAIIVILMFIIAFGMGIILIRAALPTRKMRETHEHIAVGKMGYAARKRQLKKRLVISCPLAIVSVITLVLIIPTTVADFRDAPYSFEHQRAELTWWPPIVFLLALAGSISFIVVWRGTLRRLEALSSISQ